MGCVTSRRCAISATSEARCRACSDGRSWCRPCAGRAGTPVAFGLTPSRRGRSAAPSDRGWSARKCPWSACRSRPRCASGPKSFDIATLAAAIARMPLRRSVPVRSRTWPPARPRSPAPAPFRRDRRPPRHRGRVRPTAARLPDNRSSAWRRRPSPAPAPPRARCRARWPAASGRFPQRERPSCGTGHSGGRARLRGQRQRGVLVDEAGQGLLAPAHPVDQPESGFAEKTDPFRDTGQRGAIADFQVRGRTSAVP